MVLNSRIARRDRVPLCRLRERSRHQARHGKLDNATFLQPFLSYTFPTFTSITLNTESTYDWNNDQWTVPINLMATQILKMGKMPVSLQLGGRYYAEGPDGGPEWGLRFTFTFLFPKQ
jgi:hypothetical protein